MTESREIKIVYLSHLNEEQRRQIEAVAPGVSVRVARSEKEAWEDLPGAEVVASLGWEFSREAFVRAKKLRWIHSLSAGVDALFYPEFIASEVRLTNSRGVYDIPVAEHAFALLTCLTRGIDRFHKNQAEHKWARSPVTEMDGQVLGIIGLGSIGREIARKAKTAYNMKVIATKKRLSEAVPHVDVLLPVSEMDKLLAESDFVVVAAALTEETTGLIGEKELKSMKPTAYIVNIARGRIIQSHAIMKALHQGWIAGAGLDVTDPEPLPPDSELYDTPNLIITPHMAASALAHKHVTRSLNVFINNLKSYLKDEQMPTYVDKIRRY
ncbi:MAG: D-2-hydroxyacid dehydrogenase [bacterium]|jgi:D-2-hydroxyacid dehydrogenase (NADP+)